MKGIRQRYGASPLHLLLVLVSFALALYAGLRLLKGNTIAVAIWFIAAALLHDLVLLPLYTLTDRAVQNLLPGRTASGAGTGRSWINYIRVPGFLSLLLLVVWYPLILQRVPGYRATTGLAPGTFLGHWLLVTAALLAASALCLLGTMIRSRPPRSRTREG